MQQLPLHVRVDTSECIICYCRKKELNVLKYEVVHDLDHQVSAPKLLGNLCQLFCGADKTCLQAPAAAAAAAQLPPCSQLCTCLPKVYRFSQYFDMFPHKCIDKCFTTYLRPTQALDTCSALLVRQIGVWKLVRLIIRHNRSWAT